MALGRGAGRSRGDPGVERGADSRRRARRARTTWPRSPPRRSDAGNLLIPLVRHLTRRVACSRRDGGRTRALGRHEPGRDRHGAGAATARGRCRHRWPRSTRPRPRPPIWRAATSATPIAGRTWLQQATPTTFGAKAAAWLDAHRPGASAAGERPRRRPGRAVRRRHRHAVEPRPARARRGRGAGGPPRPARARPAVAHRAQPTGRRRVRAGHDVRLAGQGRPRHRAPGADRGRRGRRAGGSRARRLVVDAAQAQPRRGRRAAVAAAVQAPGLVATMLSAMPQEHERAVGGWQAEWETLPALVDLTPAIGAGAWPRRCAHLVVDEARMRANLDAAGGVARAEGLVAAPGAARSAGATRSRWSNAACRRALAEGRAAARGGRRRAADSRLPRRRSEIASALDPGGFTGFEPHVRRPRPAPLAARAGSEDRHGRRPTPRGRHGDQAHGAGRRHVDRAVAATTPLTAEFQDLITRYAWGEIWTRPGLDLRSRRILVDRHDGGAGTLGGTAHARARRRWPPAASAPTNSRRSSCSRRSTVACRRPTMRWPSCRRCVAEAPSAR